MSAVIESIILAGGCLVAGMLAWCVVYPVLCILSVAGQVFLWSWRLRAYRRRHRAWKARQPGPIACGPYRSEVAATGKRGRE